MSRRRRYQTQDPGGTHVYGPSGLYYVGLLISATWVTLGIRGFVVRQPPGFIGFAIWCALLISMIGGWRRFTVSEDETTVLGPGWRRRFRLTELGFAGLREAGKSSLTPGNVTSAQSAFAHRFVDGAGRRAFVVGPWIVHRKELIRLLLQRIRLKRESTFE